jgi:hypothetical protein
LTVDTTEVTTSPSGVLMNKPDAGKGRKGGGFLGLLRALLGLGASGAGKSALDEIGKDGDPTSEINTVFEAAKNGGWHAGFLRENLQKSLNQVTKTARSLNERIAEHEEYIANPLKKVQKDVWDNLDQRARDGLIRHWSKEIEIWKQQLDILRKVLEDKNGGGSGTA